MTDKTNLTKNIFPLNEKESFKTNLNSSISEVLYKYVCLITEYILFISENFKNENKNKVYLKFILIRGLDTITNVFNLILFYTKNLDITYFHSQKAFYFYVEFIEQISNDKNSFLNLSSRDAIMYVYKKTIFLINQDNKKNTNSLDNNHLELLNEYIIVNKLLFVKLLSEDSFIEIHEKKELINKISKINHKINSILFSKKEELESIQFFIHDNQHHFSNLNNINIFNDKITIFLKTFN
jgi:hypothetical protein